MFSEICMESVKVPEGLRLSRVSHKWDKQIDRPGDFLHVHREGVSHESACLDQPIQQVRNEMAELDDYKIYLHK